MTALLRAYFPELAVLVSSALLVACVSIGYAVTHGL